MRYCTKCKILTRDHEKCPFCSRKTIDNPSHFSFFFIITANGFELERIRAALNDAGIPYSYNESVKDTGLQILNSAPPENCDVYVPLSAYAQACELLTGIGALKEEPDIPADDELLENAKKDAKREELDPQKAKRIRIISLIVFLLILAAVAFITDFIVDMIIRAFSS